MRACELISALMMANQLILTTAESPGGRIPRVHAQTARKSFFASFDQENSIRANGHKVVQATPKVVGNSDCYNWYIWYCTNRASHHIALCVVPSPSSLSPTIPTARCVYICAFLIRLYTYSVSLIPSQLVCCLSSLRTRHACAFLLLHFLSRSAAGARQKKGKVQCYFVYERSHCV